MSTATRGRSRTLLMLGLVWSAASALAASQVAIDSAEALRRHVATLASPEFDGRMTGTDGERRAASYIAEQLTALGVQPLPGQKSHLQEFEFTAGTEDDGTRLSLLAGAGEPPSVEWSGVESVRALSFSDNAVAEGSLVFAGYGLTVPDGQEFGYDSFAGLDVRDKIVLVLRYSPEEADEPVRSALARYSGLRYKALRARELGARALLVVTGPRSSHAGETIPMTFDTALSGSGIVAASINGEVAARLLGPGRDIGALQQALDGANPHVTGFALPEVTVRVDARVRRERQTGRNVLGLLPARPGEGVSALDGLVVMGAHYDHLGRGSRGNSLARKDEAGQPHVGADDNASGVAALLSIAGELASKPRRRAVLLGFWSGEELGLLGSTHFVKSGLVPVEQLGAYINFDMVGRMRDERLDLQGAGSSPAWGSLIERTNVAFGLDARAHDDPFLPTDSSTFYQAGVPALSFFTGSHEDYHRPTDRPETLNYEGLARIAGFAGSLVHRLTGLETLPEFRQVVRTTTDRGDRDTLRGYTGTIPDYTTEVVGLRLAGVVGGGPADLAGLRQGDVIVEFAGRKITNIYDYTYALDAIKVGQPVAVVVEREGQRLSLSVTPTRRP